MSDIKKYELTFGEFLFEVFQRLEPFHFILSQVVLTCLGNCYF